MRGGQAGEDPLDAQGAGDQGMMFGYACDETPDLMPLPIWTAHRLAERLAEVRKSGQVPYLRPDGKTQVTYEYEDGVPVALKTVLICTQHQDGIDRDTVIRPDLIEQVIRPTIPDAVRRRRLRRCTSTRPARSCSAGRTPTAASPGARSSSTPTAAWAVTAAARSAARTRARSTVRPPTPPAGWPSTSSPRAPPTRCEVQVAYAIGVAHPMSVLVETFGTNTVDPERDRQGACASVFDLRPGAIIRDLDLKRPIYRETAAYGHFGRSRPEFTWEHTSRLDEFKAAVGV